MNRDELKAQIGRLIITGWDTPVPSADFLRFLSKASIGGVILFEEQCRSADLIRTNLARIRESLNLNPFVAVDQEGGRVCRIKGAPACYAAAAKYGNNNNLELFSQEFTRSMVYLESLGINLLLGPVADIFLNKKNSCLEDRCFGTDAGTVALFVAQAVYLAHDAGLLACLKHFPGLGAATVDPHMGIAEADYTRAQWLEREKIPFEDGLAKGADLVMTTHLRLPEISEETVTGSSLIINDLLRQELDYEGAVITDDLTMAGAKEMGNPGERALKAFLAGHDILLFGREWSAAEAAHTCLVNAFEDGVIEPERLILSLDRVTALRYKLGQPSVPINGTF